MNLKDYLKKNKIPIRTFADSTGLSRYSVHKYIRGSKPSARCARIIMNATDGMVSFTDLGYELPPKKPIKEF